jgi:septum formation protein
MKSILLASQSPRRHQLLEWAEIPFEVQVSQTDERFPPELSPEEAAVYIAREKARVIAKNAQPERVVLAADTIVVLDNNMIGKPVDRQDAIQILTALSGKKHKVITGVVALKADREWSFYDTTEVQFHSLSAEDISFYVDKYKPYDKAGAYAIQEWIGVVGIKSVVGDFYNVMGLPVSRVLQLLREINQ